MTSRSTRYRSDEQRCSRGADKRSLEVGCVWVSDYWAGRSIRYRSDRQRCRWGPDRRIVEIYGVDGSIWRRGWQYLETRLVGPKHEDLHYIASLGTRLTKSWDENTWVREWQRLGMKTENWHFKSDTPTILQKEKKSWGRTL